MLDPFVDRGFEFRDIVEDASADALARDLGEEPLDEIEPRTGCRRDSTVTQPSQSNLRIHLNAATNSSRIIQAWPSFGNKMDLRAVRYGKGNHGMPRPSFLLQVGNFHLTRNMDKILASVARSRCTNYVNVFFIQYKSR